MSARASMQPAADEAVGRIGAAASLVDRPLGIGAHRPGTVDHSIGEVGSEDRRGRRALLYPPLEVGQRVERIRPLAAARAWHHEETEELARLAIDVAAVLVAAVHEACHLVVVLDALG